MTQFTSLLNTIHEKLDLPQPTKSRILLEIAADLEDVYHAYLEQGMTQSDAIQKAEEKCNLTDEALAELIKIHSTPFRRWMVRLSAQVQTRWERIMMTLVLIIIASFSAQAISTNPFFLKSSKFIWPILTLLFALTGIALYKAYALFIKKDHNIRTLHKGVNLILYGSGASLAIGAFGLFAEAFLSGMDSAIVSEPFLILALSPAAEISLELLTDWFMRGASLMMISLATSIVLAIIWFTLSSRIHKIQIAEALHLLNQEEKMR